MNATIIMAQDRKELSELALKVGMYLIVGSILAFYGGWTVLVNNNGLIEEGAAPIVKLCSVLALGLIGFSGSGVAALTSCLDRYATGFERENGTKFPAEIKEKQAFNRRMAG